MNINDHEPLIELLRARDGVTEIERAARVLMLMGQGIDADGSAVSWVARKIEATCIVVENALAKATAAGSRLD